MSSSLLRPFRILLTPTHRLTVSARTWRRSLLWPSGSSSCKFLARKTLPYDTYPCSLSHRKHTNMCGIPRIPSSALAGSTHASLFDHLPAALPEPATVDPGPSAVSEPHGADATAAAGLSLTPTTEEERVLEEAGGMDPELYMELFHDAKNRSAHR